MAKQTANIITSVRILCSICLLFCTTFSVGFYAFYLLGGISDMTDGFVARKTNSVSSFGSKLDSVADFVFIISVCIKLFPAVDISKGIWVFMLIILALKIFNVFFGIRLRKKFIFQHTVMNKITGFIMFVLPFTLSFIELRYSAGIICIMAFASAVQEGYYIGKGIEKI